MESLQGVYRKIDIRQTSFITCNNDTDDRWRHCYWRKIIAGVVVAGDKIIVDVMESMKIRGQSQLR
jgi:hypothetical protein